MQKSSLSDGANMADLRRQTDPDLFTLEEARDILALEGFKPCTDYAGNLPSIGYAQAWHNTQTGVYCLLTWFGPSDAYIHRRMGHTDTL